MHKKNPGKSLNQKQLYKKYRNLYYRLIQKAKVKYQIALLYKFKGDVIKDMVSVEIGYWKNE